MGVRRRPVVLGFSLADCVRRAAQQSDLKLEAIAEAMGVSKQQLAAMSGGREHFAFDRLLMAVESDPDLDRFYTALLDAVDVALGRERDSLESLLRQALAIVDGERRRIA